MAADLELLLATGNVKKQAELRALLEPLGVLVVLPGEVGGLPDVVEDAPTFEGNAAKKACAAALATRLWALADDSGLEVEHLEGAPGVRSARFAGAHGDDDANNLLLLERMEGVPDSRRGARFVCALALARPDGSLVAELVGTARGRILHAPRGDRDFGYDPLFLFTEEGYEETGRAFAELPPESKARVSHRGRALAERARRLPGILADAR